MNKDIINIFNITKFKTIFKKLMITPKELTYPECSFLLSAALILIQYYDTKQIKIYFDLAYYIILKYSITFNDYRPLYELSLNMGLYSVSSYVYGNKLINEDNLTINLIEEEIKSIYRKNNLTLTKEQYNIGYKLLNDKSNNLSFIAPTSYGKSEIIKEHIVSNKYHKICIVVPTKSLISQTYDLFRRLNLKYKIIIHDEMYNNETKFIAILTQERALRLVEKFTIKFDMLYIDEAHNLFEMNSRAILLTRLIRIVKSCNILCHIMYLSPIINDSNNLLMDNNEDICEYKIIYDMKQAEYYIYDYETTKIEKYNKYTNEYYDIGQMYGYLSYIFSNCGEKNFLFAITPKNIEQIVREICNYNKYTSFEENKLNEIIHVLEENIHVDFFEIEAIKHGCIYLHSLIPDHVKDYLQMKFKQIKDLKYIIANEVILEGINMPIDKLFILNTHNININKLINLIGRVNRLNYVFNGKNNLNKLLPQIHFINHKFYSRDMKKLLNNIGENTKDIIKNPILRNYKEKKLNNDKVEKIISDEKIYFSNPKTEIESIKRLLVKVGLNSVYKINDVFCSILQERMKKAHNIGKENFLDSIYEIFFYNIKYQYFLDKEVARLQNIQAIKFYKLFYANRTLPLNEIIQKYYNYYNSKKYTETPYLYIGHQFGEMTSPYSKLNKKYQKKVYVDITKKSKKELINLLIIKHSIEQQFVTYTLNKFIQLLFERKMIDKKTYNFIMYGCIDDFEVKYIQIGIPLNIIYLLKKDDQLKNIIQDKYNNFVATEEFKKYYNTLDDFKKFVIEKYIII